MVGMPVKHDAIPSCMFRSIERFIGALNDILHGLDLWRYPGNPDTAGDRQR